ncbi:MAG: hypothetical protein AAGG48_31325 [Planctomycetota bacterium]
MFAYVAAAMGACELISEEDAGSLFDDSGELIRPDFRIVTRDALSLLVEVKNFHKAPFKTFTMKGKYLQSLKRYPRLNKVPLHLAIYWSRWNLWTHLDTDRLDETQETIAIELLDAVKNNDMRLLGDCMIGTVSPLSFRLYARQDIPQTFDEDGVASFYVTWSHFPFKSRNQAMLCS